MKDHDYEYDEYEYDDDDLEEIEIVPQKGSKEPKSGFTQVPNKVLTDVELSISARLLYCVLASYAWDKDFVFPTQKTLSEDIGLSIRRVRDLLKELESKGYIKTHRRGYESPNIYELLYLPKSKTFKKRYNEIFSEELNITSNTEQEENSPSMRQDVASSSGRELPTKNTINKDEYSSKETKRNKVFLHSFKKP